MEPEKESKTDERKNTNARNSERHNERLNKKKEEVEWNSIAIDGT